MMQSFNCHLGCLPKLLQYLLLYLEWKCQEKKTRVKFLNGLMTSLYCYFCSTITYILDVTDMFHWNLWSAGVLVCFRVFKLNYKIHHEQSAWCKVGWMRSYRLRKWKRKNGLEEVRETKSKTAIDDSNAKKKMGNFKRFPRNEINQLY